MKLQEKEKLLSDFLNELNHNHGLFASNKEIDKKYLHDEIQQMKDHLAIPIEEREPLKIDYSNRMQNEALYSLPLFTINFQHDNGKYMLSAVSYDIGYDEKNKYGMTDYTKPLISRPLFRRKDDLNLPLADQQLAKELWKNIQNERDMKEYLYSQAISLTTGLSLKTTHDLVVKNQDLDVMAGYHTLDTLSKQTLKTFIKQNALSDNQDLHVHFSFNDSFIYENNLEDSYLKPSKRTFENDVFTTKVMNCAPVNIMLDIVPNALYHSIENDFLQKHKATLDANDDLKSLSDIKLVLVDPATNITQPKEANDDYYIAQGKILKNEYNMSWKAICNHNKEIAEKETIENIEQPESLKVKKLSLK